MNFYIASLIMTIVANVLYHSFQKSIRVDIHPLVSLAITYATALIFTCALIPFMATNGASIRTQITPASWASFALGFAIVLLELGFLLAYRAGWELGSAALTSNVVVGIVLVPIGLFAAGEEITLQRTAGILLAIAGLFLMNRR